MHNAAHTILVIARNTFRETVRNKILFGIFAFAVAYFAFTVFLGTISLGEDLHVIRSLGLAGIYLFGVIITVFLGSTLIYKEIERKTLYFVLPKPIARSQVIVGKFLGLLASVGVSLAGMLGAYLAVVALKGGGFDALAAIAVFYQLCEMALLIALTVFFSTFAQPLMSTLYAVLIVYIGHSLDLLVTATAKGSIVMQWVVKALYYILPNLTKFDIRTLVIYDAQITLAAVIVVVAYAAAYSAALLYAAVLIFEKREL